MAEDEDLGILGKLVRTVYADELEQATDETVEERERHRRSVLVRIRPGQTGQMRFRGPFRLC